MVLSENPEDPGGSGPRDLSPAILEGTARGRKRAHSALTTTCGSSKTRDHSKDIFTDFKRVRTQTPVEGSVFRDRSNDGDINFKRPRGLPKQRRRPKKPASRGNTATTVNVSSRDITTPTSASAPPTYSFPHSLAPPPHSLAPPPPVSKVWTDYDEEDKRRIYEEDLSTLFMDDGPEHPPTPHYSDPLTLSPSEDPLTLSPKQDPPVRFRFNLCYWNSCHFESDLIKFSIYLDRLDRLNRKKVIMKLLQREDEQSEGQNSVRSLEKNKLEYFRTVFKDIETGETSGSDFCFESNYNSSVFSKNLEVNEDFFLFFGDQQKLREETDRLCRYKELLMEWCTAFRREEHGVSEWVGEALEEMLREVQQNISYLYTLGRMKSQCLPSKSCSGISICVFRKLRKKTLSTFYQSSVVRKRRSVSERNTRKWLRHLHTRRAAVTLSRSRRALKACGHKLCCHFSHRSALALNPDDTTTVPQNSE